MVSSNIRVRIIGIDTPETKHPNKGLEFYGLEAAEKTKSILHTQDKVCLLSDPLADKLDRYGRVLAHVFTTSGIDLGRTLLESGSARGYYRFPFTRKQEFRLYETTAKERALGLWNRSDER